MRTFVEKRRRRRTRRYSRVVMRRPQQHNRPPALPVHLQRRRLPLRLRPWVAHSLAPSRPALRSPHPTLPCPVIAEQRWWLPVPPADQLRTQPRTDSDRLMPPDVSFDAKGNILSHPRGSIRHRGDTLANPQVMHIGTGVRNLGKSCWMSTAVQLLFNCDAFREDFAKGSFLEDLHVSLAGVQGQMMDPLHHAPITMALASTFRDMDCGRYTSVAPRELRACIAKHLRLVEGADAARNCDPSQCIRELLLGTHTECNRAPHRHCRAQDPGDVDNWLWDAK
eukprot:gene15288-18006_t